ncbi:MAG: ABC transporter permease [Gemmatimonadaceae bacterium]|nr:ABC transporter permease [Gemmatimonadaceae bacterium]
MIAPIALPHVATSPAPDHAMPTPGSVPPARLVVLHTARLVGRDLVRNRWLLSSALGFALVTELLIRLGGDGLRIVASLVNVVLAATPLVSAVFTVVYWHVAQDFVALLLAQPLRRSAVFAGVALGLVVPLAAAFVAGVGLPLVVHRSIDRDTARAAFTLLGCGVALTATFSGLALAIAVRSADRVRALGAVLALWGLLAIAYDGVVLFITTRFSDYALERPLLALAALNPIDLARVLLLLEVDRPMLLGYTGAVLERFFGGATGSILAGSVLLLWIVVPMWIAARGFARRDL